MTKSIYQSTFWKGAATAGFKLGVAMIVIAAIDSIAHLQLDRSWIVTLLRFAAIAGAAYYFPTQLARRCGDEGLSYGQSMSFILALMLFAGVIDGLSQFFFQNYIAPEYYQQVIDKAMAASGIDPNASDTMGQAYAMTQRLMRSPIVMVLSGIFSMVIYGGFIGLFASIFVRRPAPPFTNHNEQQQEN